MSGLQTVLQLQFSLNTLCIQHRTE
uniref:Uncharacterized protein n=1 Tax=Anguilla anguilla TaxID=7936 RepID=A0A0E9U1T1_ANGAN